MEYNKPSTSIEEQLELLRRRGMEVPDTDAFRFYLTHIGYYRLRGYWIPFEQQSPRLGDHHFHPGTTFDAVMNLYAFDRELRLLISDAIERVEVSVRNTWVAVLASAHGPHAYLKSRLFTSYREYGRCLAELSGECERSKETFVKHYKKKYNEPDLPPIWSVAEIMTLGQFSRWLSNLRKKSLRARIAKVYGLNESVLVSFMHHLTIIRNICAHHGRLWNREVTFAMQLPRSKPARLVASFVSNPNPNQPSRKIYNTLVMLSYLMDCISPGHRWKRRLKDIIDRYAADISSMGFPEDFIHRPIWIGTWDRNE